MPNFTIKANNIISKIMNKNFKQFGFKSVISAKLEKKWTLYNLNEKWFYMKNIEKNRK
jgi:hypothetical protein